MRNYKHFLLLSIFISLVGFSACTYRGTIKEDFYHLNTTSHDKIPLNICLLQERDLASKRFTGEAYSRNLVFDFHNAFVAGLKTELNDVFKRVDIIRRYKACDSKNLVATIEYDWIQNRSAYLFNIRLQFKEPSSMAIVSEVDHTEILKIPHPGGIYSVTEYILRLSLGLTAPVTAPIGTHGIGKSAESELEKVLMSTIESISNKISADERLIAYSKGEALPPLNIASAEKTNSTKASLQEDQPPSIYDDFLNSVVVIRGINGIGTGFFIDSNGLIITNEHVVGSDRLVSVRLRDNRTVFGNVKAIDRDRDLALVALKITDAPYLQLADANEGGIGTEVIAIGTPQGLDWSLTRGLVSAIRDIQGVRVVQTDTAMNPGNSGGPLISLETGHVIGVNTMGFRKDLSEGLNFAVSAREIMVAFPNDLKP